MAWYLRWIDGLLMAILDAQDWERAVAESLKVIEDGWTA